MFSLHISYPSGWSVPFALSTVERFVISLDISYSHNLSDFTGGMPLCLI